MTQTYAIAAAIVVSLAAPLVGAVVGAFSGNSKRLNGIVQTIFVLGSFAGLSGSVAFLFLQERGLFAFGAGHLLRLSDTFPWIPANIGVVDTLSGFFLLIVNIGVLLASWFGASYLPRYVNTYRINWVNAAVGAFVFGMLATVLSGSVITFLFSWELMSVAAYFLVIADRTEASVAAGLFYLVMTQLGAACLFAGFLIFAHGDPHATLASLAGGATGPLALLGFFLLFAGFAGKAGIFPLHEWLPAAHPQAPSHASALMSGVMLKVALYGTLRTLMTVMHFDIPLLAILIIIALGLFSGFYGALMAVVETDLKRMLAWSSIENLGLLFAIAGTMVFFVQASLPGVAGLIWVALLVHALNHTVFKSGLFMAAGAVISGTHTRDLDRMGGLARVWPGFSKWFLGLVFAAAALPPLGTFYGEWLFMQTVAASLAALGPLADFLLIVILSAFALTAGLALFAFVKLFVAVFLSKPRSSEAEHAAPLPASLIAPIAGTVLISSGIGVFMPQFLSAIWSGARGAFYDGAMLTVAGARLTPVAIVAFMAVAFIVVVFVRRYFASRKIVVTDTWDCGQPLTPRMEYTSSGFAAPIRFFFRSISLPWKRFVATPVSSANPWIATRRIEHGYTPLASRFLYAPVVRSVRWIAARVKRLQNGVVQFYIALVVVTLVVVLIVAL